MTSNLSAAALFGSVGGYNLKARAMMVNLGNVSLFPIIDEIINVHNLDPIVENGLLVPNDISGSE